MKRICIVGGGFAGLGALQHLCEALEARRNIHVTLIDPRTHFVCTPLMADVATGVVTSRSTRVRLAALPPKARFDIVQDRLEGLDMARGEVRCAERVVPYDHLILAAGAQTAWGDFKDPDKLALPWRGDRQATALGRRVLRAFAQQGDDDALRRALRFTIVGGGPSGVELAAELASRIQRDLLDRVGEQARRHHRVVLIEAQRELLPNFPATARRHARRALERLGVDLHLNTRVTAFDGRDISLADGETLPGEHLIWAGGVEAPGWTRDLGLPLSDEGFVLVEDTLSVPDVEGIFVAGDLAHRRDGLCWPKLAASAAHMGPVAAENVLLDLVGASMRPFDYTHLGHLLRLGRGEGLVLLADERLLTGSLASATAHLARLAQLPTWTKRAALAMEWFGGSAWRHLPIV